MTYDEIEERYPIGLSCYCSALARAVTVQGWGHKYQVNDEYCLVWHGNGNTAWVKYATLYANENHDPLYPDETQQVQQVAQEEHVMGLSPESINPEAWKSFKGLL